MARLPRLTLAGHLHHVIQRGNNGQTIFANGEDFEAMLEMLDRHARAHSVAIHAFVLTGEDFHLLATPVDPKGIALLMQSVGRSYVRYFNGKYRRSGTLWDGRYRSTVMQAEGYLLAGMVFLDLIPVRAGLVTAPADYPWSSHRHYAGVQHQKLLTPHALAWSLGNTPFAREAVYRALVSEDVSPQCQTELTDAVHRGWALGDAAYLELLQNSTTRRVAKARRGRPATKVRS